jgi:hypothetical protein
VYRLPNEKARYNRSNRWRRRFGFGNFNRKERKGNQTNLAPLRLGARHSFPDLFFIQKFQIFLASSLLLARPSCSMLLARSS